MKRMAVGEWVRQRPQVSAFAFRVGPGGSKRKRAWGRTSSPTEPWRGPYISSGLEFSPL